MVSRSTIRFRCPWRWAGCPEGRRRPLHGPSLLQQKGQWPTAPQNSCQLMSNLPRTCNSPRSSDYAFLTEIDLARRGRSPIFRLPLMGNWMDHDRTDVLGQTDFSKYFQPSPTAVKPQSAPTLQKGLQAIGIMDSVSTHKSKDQILAELDKIAAQNNIQPGQKETVEGFEDFINVYAHGCQDALNPPKYITKYELIPGDALYLGLPLPSSLSRKFRGFLQCQLVLLASIFKITPGSSCHRPEA